ncbi:hypothetical protein [Microcystis aeruginosa]|uniref:hypothetical protein n=1 Tax=Microcystis aeruginosa TaxID=1126 RepID=UPI00232CE945|nr:hypothetical protein [Microcystis aeruginosa]MDB9415927.1 hypothetical protein [Microcystis aeruginosa CS-556/03]
MKTKSIISLLSLSIMGMSIYAGQANSSDYRALTPEEKSRLTDALLKQGCRNPKAMKFDVETNLFEAEDAVCEGGRKLTDGHIFQYKDKYCYVKASNS